jgi:hypothetical protein
VCFNILHGNDLAGIDAQNKYTRLFVVHVDPHFANGIEETSVAWPRRGG